MSLATCQYSESTTKRSDHSVSISRLTPTIWEREALAGIDWSATLCGRIGP